MKSLDDRIQECIQIKKQLEGLGILVIKEYKEILSKNMNAFIQKGLSNTFYFKIPNSKIEFQVVLINTINKKSGIYKIID